MFIGLHWLTKILDRCEEQSIKIKKIGIMRMGDACRNNMP